MSTLKLYDEVIKTHSKTPYHFQKPEMISTLTSNSPVCGDKFDFYLLIDNEVIKSIHFHGFGCAVSKATSSVMVQILEGKTKQQARSVCNQFVRLLKNGVTENEVLFNEEFNSFKVVREIPERFDCAALPWIEMEKYLAR